MRWPWLQGAIIVLVPAAARAADDCATDVSGRQGVSAFSLLTDGQPNGPGQPQLDIVGSVGDGTDQLGGSIGYTPASSALCNTSIALGTPGLTRTGDRTVFDHDIDVRWLQRWRADGTHGPTVSTVVELEIPVDNPGEKVQVTFTGVIARSFGAGTAYLNLLVSSPDGATADDWTTGVLVGWQQPLPGGSSLIVDGGVQPGGARVVELSWQRPIGPHLTFGPGLSLQRSDGQTQFSFGVQLQATFGRPRQ